MTSDFEDRSIFEGVYEFAAEGRELQFHGDDPGGLLYKVFERRGGDAWVFQRKVEVSWLRGATGAQERKRCRRMYDAMIEAERGGD